jgi:hypothetical protein
MIKESNPKRWCFLGLLRPITAKVNIPLLKNKMGASTTDKVIGSVQNLEYSIADALKQSH